MHFDWQQLCESKLLISAGTAWLIAQLLKTLLYLIMNREWNWERLVGAGGMPSSHAALVCNLAVGTLVQYGLGSFEFAICFVLAVIVLHDARGVRLEAGRQAKILNELIRSLQYHESSPLANVYLKELVGHTPLQVLAGALLGIIIALFFF